MYQLYFFKSIIGLIQIFFWGRRGNSYFCRLNFENITIIIYIYIKGNFKILRQPWRGPPPIYIYSSTPDSTHTHTHIYIYKQQNLTIFSSKWSIIQYLLLWFFFFFKLSQTHLRCNLTLQVLTLIFFFFFPNSD